MDVLLFSVVPYPPGLWVVFFTLPIVVACFFVRATTRKDRGKERDRRAGLGLVAILCGPLLGAILAGLATHLGDVHPLDVRYTYWVFISIGAIAGFLTGCAFAVAALFSPRAACRKDSLAKAPEPWDEF
jgi:MFS family permease